MLPPGGHTGRTYLRLSITDRCNLRCRYCRPESAIAEPVGSAGADDGELMDLVRLVHEETGLYKLRLSGGEPLMHPRAAQLTARLRRLLPDARLCLTTNGILLPKNVDPLRQAGLDRVNISLDSLDPDGFREVTSGGNLESTLQGIYAATRAGFSAVKINTVLIRRINGDRLPDLVRFAAGLDCEIRFIELMPFGHGAALSQTDYLAADEALGKLKHAFRYLGQLPSTGTAARYRFLVDDTPAVVGMINPVSHPFCSRCDRLRLSRRGQLLACLRQSSSVDLLTPLRTGDEDTVRRQIRTALRTKHDPGQHWPQRHMVTIGG